MSVEVATLLGDPEAGFTEIGAVERYDGDRDYVHGAIRMTVEYVPLLTEAEWDDVNWLWPFVVKASLDCEQTGRGETLFPDQPIEFRVERHGDAERVRVTVTVPGKRPRTAVTSARAYSGALAAAGLHFFAHLERLVPRSADTDRDKVAALRRWASAGP